MTRYQITAAPASILIELTEVAGQQAALLGAFQACQEGRCACPTDEYQKVAAMDVRAGQDRIAIRLDAKEGERFDRSEIAACLDHTVELVGSEQQTSEAR